MLENDIKLLGEKLKNGECPMCKGKDFSFVDGYFANTVQPDTTNIVIGGKRIPSVVIVCNNCGFISQHAIGVLKDNAK